MNEKKKHKVKVLLNKAMMILNNMAETELPEEKKEKPIFIYRTVLKKRQHKKNYPFDIFDQPWEKQIYLGASRLKACTRARQSFEILEDDDIEISVQYFFLLSDGNVKTVEIGKLTKGAENDTINDL